MQVIRRDKVAQAVSLWTAIQTQAWRDGDDDGPRRAGLLGRRHHATSSSWLTLGERAWTAWLAHRDPDVVVYEDFVRDPSPTIEALTGRAGARRRRSSARRTGARRRGSTRYRAEHAEAA